MKIGGALGPDIVEISIKENEQKNIEICMVAKKKNGYKRASKTVRPPSPGEDFEGWIKKNMIAIGAKLVF